MPSAGRATRQPSPPQRRGRCGALATGPPRTCRPGEKKSPPADLRERCKGAGHGAPPTLDGPRRRAITTRSQTPQTPGRGPPGRKVRRGLSKGSGGSRKPSREHPNNPLGSPRRATGWPQAASWTSPITSRLCDSPRVADVTQGACPARLRAVANRPKGSLWRSRAPRSASAGRPLSPRGMWLRPRRSPRRSSPCGGDQAVRIAHRARGHHLRRAQGQDHRHHGPVGHRQVGPAEEHHRPAAPDAGEIWVDGEQIVGMGEKDLYRAPQVRRALPGRRPVRLDEPVRQHRVPAA